MNDDSLQHDVFAHLADEFVARYRRGERPALSEYCVLHPQLADDIRRVFPTLVVMGQARRAQGTASSCDARLAPIAAVSARSAVGGAAASHEHRARLRRRRT